MLASSPEQGYFYIPGAPPVFNYAHMHLMLLHVICILHVGTDATHAEHIETIKTRNYVGVQPDGGFVPGELGMGLVEGMCGT